MSELDAHERNVVLCGSIENAGRFPVRHAIQAKTVDLMSPSLALQAAAYLRRGFSPDLIHAHFGWSGIRVLLLKHFLGIPLVTSFGGRDVGVQMNAPHFDRLYQMLFAASDRIVCVSDHLRGELEACGVDPARIVVIRRGARLRDFPFHDRRDRHPGAEVQILAVGRLVEKKGHRSMLAAIAPLVRAGVRLRLTLLGSGEEQRDLERLRNRLGLRGVVHFEPPGGRASLLARLHEADIFVHPSVTGRDGDTEGIPNALVEAAATGLPVIGTRHGGIPEAVQDGKTGLLVPERDVEALARALGTLVSNPSLRWQMGRAAHERTARAFDLRQQVEAHVDLYKEVQSEAARRQAPAPSSWLGSDFLECAGALFPEPFEGSLSALFDRTVGEPLLRIAMARGEPGWLARLYGLRSLLPISTRVRLKRHLLPIALSLLGQREGRAYVAQRRDLRRIERRLLGRENAFELSDPQWSVLAERAVCRNGRLGFRRDAGPGS